MKNKNKMIKLPIHLDWINEIIYGSIIFIVFGIAYLFAFNFLRFNWYSVFFSVLTLVLIYFKRASYLKIEDDRLKIVYFHFYEMFDLKMNQVEQCIFYEGTRRVDILTNQQETISLYLKERHKETLLDGIIQRYPHISPIYIQNC